VEKNKEKPNDIANYYGIIGRDKIMEGVINHTDDLIKAIKKTKEYIKYQELLKNVMQDELLYGKINDIRRRNLSMQVSEGTDLIEENTKLYVEYTKELSNSLVKEFLSAEARYCNMVKLVNDKIMESLDFDIDFLEG
jgi:cell fate (sporulation/competence/biofilm development) regulator YlbF (YheA/YmcA/DUF963 family)